MENFITIQDIDVNQAYLVTTDIIANTCRIFGAIKCIELEDGSRIEAIAKPLDLEI